jgi:hypothetical protein
MMACSLGFGEKRSKEFCAVQLAASVLECSWKIYTFMYKDDMYGGFVGWQAYTYVG